MENFEWQPGGKELLLVIQLFIRENGGNLSLAKKIIAEERAARNKKPDEIKTFRPGRTTKPVRLWKGRQFKRFKDSDMAAKYLGTSKNNLQSCIHLRCKVRGWNAAYYEAKPRVNNIL